MERLIHRIAVYVFLIIGLSVFSIPFSNKTGSFIDSAYARGGHGNGGGNGGGHGNGGKSVPEPTLALLLIAASGGLYLYKKVSRKKSA